MLSIDNIKQAALEVGFDDCGVARADALGDEEYPLREWLRRGWHGELHYMERNVEKRLDPRLLVEGARSVICVVSAYPPPSGCAPATGRIAAYARHRDYHEDIKRMLFALRERLGIDGKLCCDTVPISDKHWAARAGLGWIGRHTLLVTPRWGTWVNLGEIVTTEECDRYDSPLIGDARPEGRATGQSRATEPGCEGCMRCVRACPNHALAVDGLPMLDVRRCTAYHTIENRSETLPEDLNTAGYAFGCDLCQMACPYNRITSSPHPLTSSPKGEGEAYGGEGGSLDVEDEESFRKATEHTAISRITFAQWQRNNSLTPSPSPRRRGE